MDADPDARQRAARLAALVDRALDERRDPLDDDAVRAHLCEHPDDLGALVRLQRRLALLEGAPGARSTPPHDRASPAPSARTPRRAGPLLAAAAALVAALVVLRAWESAPPTDDTASSPRIASSPSAASAPAVPRGRVLGFRMTFTRSGPDGIRRVTTSPGRRHELRVPHDPEGPIFAWSETWSER